VDSTLHMKPVYFAQCFGTTTYNYALQRTVVLALWNKWRM
jgi:hypothetical protein